MTTTKTNESNKINKVAESRGYIKVKFGQVSPISLNYVHLGPIPQDGGIMRGSELGNDESKDFIQLTYPLKTVEGGPQVYNYPNDFEGMHAEWTYYKDEKYNVARSGKLTITIETLGKTAKGEYSFITEDGINISGDFDLSPRIPD
ncbi:hypothetical protein [Pseudomonas fluorescens]|uniref:Uncharacterized protein n=1 Tax=Pseudomonas fluorescens TaxID=294 RepID=A0A5E6S419_PSEFL|nr:hypothetical protein [Pseudomonas fluorescens]VVM71145.1 hypothetical protein PS655_01815 [Pseudomonas fluorescens]VVM71168.1 hypothetical protein PS655_01816 [Pseudomonas fluorescens]